MTKSLRAARIRFTLLNARFAFYAFRAAAFLAVLSVTSFASAVTLFWDANSNLAGTGTWDVNTTQNWRTTNTAGAPDAVWNPNDGSLTAAFGGNPGAGVAGSGVGGADGKVTVTGTIELDSLIIQPTAGNYSITGGTLHFNNPNSSIVVRTHLLGGSARAEMINSPITGTDITVVADFISTSGISSRLDLGDSNSTANPNTFTGDLIFTGTGTSFSTNAWEQICMNNSVALPSTATVRMRRDQSQLLFAAGGVAGSVAYTQTYPNNIILNDGITLTLNGTGVASNGIGAGLVGTSVKLTGVISGNSDLYFRVGANGGNGVMEIANHATYTGNTYNLTFTTGAIRVGINDALPVGTTFSFGGPTTNTANVGALDLNGFNQKLAGIVTTTTASIAGITNSSGTNSSTLTIDGNVVGTFPGLIGGSIGSVPGSNDNLALVLASTNTGTLTLSKSGIGNTYNGGTTINGGTLIAATSPAGSATGSGPVAVNNGGTLGGGGGVSGLITVASGGRIAPSNVSQANTGAIGTLRASGGVTLNSGSKLDIDLGAPAPSGGTSDKIDMPSTGVTVPAAAGSITVNLGDPAGGAAGNGTYTIMTFPTGQYTGSSNASQFVTGTLPSPNSLNGGTITYNLADDSFVNQDGTPSNATRVMMTVSGGPNALVWTGNASATWNSSDANFNNLGTGATGVTFAGNDNVSFDDSGFANTTVTIDAGGVMPNIVTVNNSTTTYALSGGDIKGSSVGGSSGLFFAGTGGATIGNNYTGAGPVVSNKTTSTGITTFDGVISNATAVTVNTGTLVLTAANTYTATNTINNGVLSIAADNNLGNAANPIVLAGGTLKTTSTFTLGSTHGISTTAAGGSAINNSPGTTLTYGGVISGTGSLTQTGGGTLILSGANTYAGTTAVTGGTGGSTLKNGIDNALPTNTELSINAGTVAGGTATYDLNGFNQTVRGISFSNTAGTTGTITNSAAGAAKTLTVNNSAAKNYTYQSVIAGNLNLVKSNTGTLTLTGANTYTGDTKVQGGTLSISNAYLADAADVYLSTGSIFNLTFATTDTIRSLFIDGIGQATGTWGAIGSAAAHTTALITGTGLLNITTQPSLPGDFNNNGTVDAADYVVWRNGGSPNPNSLSDYNLWRSNFGNHSGAGSGLGGSAAVPEPATCLLGLILFGAALLMRRRG